jgi:hypothetical protein
LLSAKLSVDMKLKARNTDFTVVKRKEKKHGTNLLTHCLQCLDLVKETASQMCELSNKLFSYLPFLLVALQILFVAVVRRYARQF